MGHQQNEGEAHTFRSALQIIMIVLRFYNPSIKTRHWKFDEIPGSFGFLTCVSRQCVIEYLHFTLAFCHRIVPLRHMYDIPVLCS